MSINIFAISERAHSLPLRQKAFLSFLAGGIAAFTMPPYGVWLFLFPALGTLYFLLSGSTCKKDCFITSYLFGFGYFVTGLWWIGNALLVEGNDYQWAWPLAVIGLPVMLALFPAICLTTLHRFANYKSLSGFCGFVFTMTLSEWLRGHLFTGFPWNLYGYGWSELDSIIQTVSFGGIYFLTLLTIFWGSATGFLLVWQSNIVRRLIFILFVTGTFGLSFLYGYNRLNQYIPSFHNDLRLRIVQTNIPQHEKWDRDFFWPNFEKYLELSQPGKNYEGRTLIIWPETAISYHHTGNKTTRQEIIDLLQRHQNGFLMTGILRRENEHHYMNSLTLYDSNLSLLKAYDKSHLVPFGEYIPLQKFIPLKTVTSFTGFKAGNGPISQNAQDIPAYSPLICYEIIFPGHVTGKKNRPEWIINVTNDGWYGDSPGPYQHLSKARFRAIEEGLPVVRVAGTGISAVIDPTGRILEYISYGKTDTLVASLPKPIEEKTFYARHRDIPTFVIMLLLFICFSLGPKHFGKSESL